VDDREQGEEEASRARLGFFNRRLLIKAHVWCVVPRAFGVWLLRSFVRSFVVRTVFPASGSRCARLLQGILHMLAVLQSLTLSFTPRW